MTASEPNNRWLHRYAVLTASATFLLIVAGALVTSNDAGLAVPDWPLSYGQVFPPMPGNIFYEHSHRLVATTVGLLTIGLVIWLARREPRRWVRRLGWIALAAVVVQGVLGGLTVIYMLPPAISVTHACLAQLFFCVTVSVALFTWRGWNSEAMPGAAQAGAPGVLRLAAIGVAAIFMQLVLGAALRHAVIGVLPHALGAIPAVGLVFATTARVYRHCSDAPSIRRPAAIAVGLALTQIFLGFGSYMLKYVREDPQPLPVPVAVTTAHVACGALLLAAMLVVSLRSGQLSGWASARGRRPATAEATS